jgi:hypothetical protein
VTSANIERLAAEVFACANDPRMSGNMAALKQWVEAGQAVRTRAE